MHYDHELEKAITDVVRVLPAAHALQVLDFARWLQTQPDLQLAGALDEERDRLAPELEEQVWLRAYEARRAEFRQLARQALAEQAQGNTYLMTVENGKLTVQ